MNYIYLHIDCVYENTVLHIMSSREEVQDFAPDIRDRCIQITGLLLAELIMSEPEMGRLLTGAHNDELHLPGNRQAFIDRLIEEGVYVSNLVDWPQT